MRRFSLPLGLTLACLLAAPAVADPSLHISGSIAGPDGRWDYASWDAAHARVLVGHGGDVLVIDPAGGTTRAIGQVAGAHAALAIPGTDTLLVTSGRDASVRILNETSGAELALITMDSDPDSAVVAPDGHTAYVMGGDSGVVTVIDLASRTVARRIALKPGLEAPVLVSANLLAVNNEELSEVDLVDLAQGKPAGMIALPGCKGPSGMAYAPEFQLSLSVCHNGVAALVDMATQRLVQLVPIGEGPDTAIWDGAHGRFLVPCGRSGTLAIIGIDNGKATAETPITTETSARTAAYDPVSGQVFLPAARFHTGSADKHPPMVAGSFHLLVLSPAR